MTINIPVSPDYKLTSDERNIIVKERYFSDPTKAPNWAKRLAENPDADPTPQEKWREVAFHSTVERMQARIDINLMLYEMADKNICDLMELLDKCLPALDKSKTGYSELSKAIRREIESFYI
ncbi:hypothetical protein [Bacillus halotolerans]|uniref:hypothetical protein n=1 Tax=Bacillus halotolerans TaxID=260554 RepID=UPI002DBD0622|nr:hypothetical protein [Bacillus halotolerans]MEC1648234.1 hypothetical protein [Bacillus halotolerans]